MHARIQMEVQSVLQERSEKKADLQEMSQSDQSCMDENGNNGRF